MGALFLASLLLSTFEDSALAEVVASFERGRAVDCGAASLWLLLRLMKREHALGQVESALDRHGAPPHSLAELRDAARELGLSLRGESFQLRDGPLDRPAIAYLHNGSEGGHFVVLRPIGFTGTMVQVLEPPYPPKVMDAEQIMGSRIWTGMILVPRDPLRELEFTLVLVGAGAASIVGCLAIGRMARGRRIPPGTYEERGMERNVRS